MKHGCFSILLFIFAFCPSAASACAVCMGGDDTVMREASNTTMWVLLALVGFIFVATGATAFFLWRKAMNAPTTSNA
jgi:multidrug resistance efflux pump